MVLIFGIVVDWMDCLGCRNQVVQVDLCCEINCLWMVVVSFVEDFTALYIDHGV